MFETESSLDTEAPSAVAQRPVRRRSRAEVAAVVWCVGLSLWIGLGFVQLPAAAALIELEGIHRGFPVTDNDHFGSLPALRDAFDTANLSLQHPFLWILVMGAFAVSGFAVAFGSARFRTQTLAAMAALWFLGIAVAATHSETLELVMWLTN